MMVGMSAFQSTHIEMDLVVGQEGRTRSSMMSHVSSSSNVNSVSSGSIGSASSNSSGQGVGEAASTSLFSDDLRSEGWAASNSPTLSRSFCRLDACPGSEATIQDFFLSCAF